ncbi:MAG TPA: ABC transporter substrate-binding protein, partial [Albitalea sp.]|nr:ABC transporter substrate-binding protein [Albitalea sp.]
MSAARPTRREWLRWFGAACAATAAAAPCSASATTLERVRERGVLTVGLYHDMPPFHVNGQGIDVELARSLAES